MATFLHLSDTHLGYKEYMMDERENDFYESFNEAIDIGLNEHVDFLSIPVIFLTHGRHQTGHLMNLKRQH